MKINQWNSTYIDLLRLISAQLVLIGHATHMYFDSYICIITPSHAVGLFFLLSGFLIAYSTRSKIVNNESYGFTKYFFDRFVRIYTALIPCLLFVVIVDFINIKLFQLDLNQTFNIKTFVANVLMFQEYPVFQHLKWFFMLDDNSVFNLKYFGSNLPLWTLAIEWWLYMFFGWLILSKKTKYYWVILSFFAVVPVYHILFSPRIEGVTLIWFVGVTIYYLLSSRTTTGSINADRYLSLLLLIVGLVSLKNNHIIIPLLVFCAWFYFTFKWLSNITLPINKTVVKTIKVGADYSFTLYLIHYPILILVKNISPNLDELMMWAIIFLINIISLLFASITEMKYKEVSKRLNKKLIPIVTHKFKLGLTKNKRH